MVGSVSNDSKKAWPSLLILSHVECTSLPFPHHTTCAKNQMAQSVCLSQITARGVNFHRRLFSFPIPLGKQRNCTLTRKEENMTKIIRHAEERAAQVIIIWLCERWNLDS